VEKTRAGNTKRPGEVVERADPLGADRGGSRSLQAARRTRKGIVERRSTNFI